MEEDIKILEEFEMFCEDMYYFVDDDMGGHFKAVIGDQKANTMLGYFKLKRMLKNLINRNKELEEIKDEAINTCFYTWNDDVELLCRKLAKYGYITIDKEKNEYISPFKDNPNLEESKDICEDISDYIPKSKVEETIEELKQEYKIELEKNSIKAFILKCKIEALEELLQEGE